MAGRKDDETTWEAKEGRVRGHRDVPNCLAPGLEDWSINQDIIEETQGNEARRQRESLGWFVSECADVTNSSAHSSRRSWQRKWWFQPYYARMLKRWQSSVKRSGSNNDVHHIPLFRQQFGSVSWGRRGGPQLYPRNISSSSCSSSTFSVRPDSLYPSPVLAVLVVVCVAGMAAAGCYLLHWIITTESNKQSTSLLQSKEDATKNNVIVTSPIPDAWLQHRFTTTVTNMYYSPDLADNTSTTFKEFSVLFCAMVQDVLITVQEYEDCRVDNIRPGSVVIWFTLKFKRTLLDSDDILNMFLEQLIRKVTHIYKNYGLTLSQTRLVEEKNWASSLHSPDHVNKKFYKTSSQKSVSVWRSIAATPPININSLREILTVAPSDIETEKGLISSNNQESSTKPNRQDVETQQTYTRQHSACIGDEITRLPCIQSLVDKLAGVSYREQYQDLSSTKTMKHGLNTSFYTHSTATLLQQYDPNELPREHGPIMSQEHIILYSSHEYTSPLASGLHVAMTTFPNTDKLGSFTPVYQSVFMQTRNRWESAQGRNYGKPQTLETSLKVEELAVSWLPSFFTKYSCSSSTHPLFAFSPHLSPPIPPLTSFTLYPLHYSSSPYTQRFSSYFMEPQAPQDASIPNYLPCVCILLNSRVIKSINAITSKEINNQSKTSTLSTVMSPPPLFPPPPMPIFTSASIPSSFNISYKECH